MKTNRDDETDDIRRVCNMLLLGMFTILAAVILLALGIFPIHDERKDCTAHGGHAMEVHGGHGGWVCTP